MGKCGGIGKHAPAVATQQLGPAELVERLTDAANDPATLTGTSAIFRQASRLLTEQAAEIERLREALKPFSLAYEMAAVLNNEVESGKVARDCVAFMDFRRAYLAIHPTAITTGAAHE